MRKKNFLIPFVVLILVFGLLGGFAVYSYLAPSKKHMDLNAYYGRPEEGEALIVVDLSVQDECARMAGGRLYLPLKMVNRKLNQRFYWDSESRQIFYATPSEIRKYDPSSEPGGDVWMAEEEQIYLSQELIAQYTRTDITVLENPSRIVFSTLFNGLNLVEVRKAGKIRYQGGIKSDILREVIPGEKLLFLEALNDWIKVGTFDGYTGYIQKSDVGEMFTEDIEKESPCEEYSYYKLNCPVNLGWYSMETSDNNQYLTSDMETVSGLNVVAPTWFRFRDNDGNLSNYGSADFVNNAHALGMQVWGLIDNIGEGFSSFEILSSYKARTHVISQLINTAEEVGMDGINVDLESLGEDSIWHFKEFLRELSIETHKRGLILSVDDPMPEDYNVYYDLEEQGKVVDYVILMGYDEHYAGGEVGSVASIGWVERGIVSALMEVPAKKLILAVPFYTRVWKLTGGAVTSEAYGMKGQNKLIAENNVELMWDGDCGQFYGEYDKEGSTYKLWAETPESIREKGELIKKYKFAGIAEWRLTLEDPEVWPVINEIISALE